MQRNNWVFVGGFALMIISLLLINYVSAFILVFFITGVFLYFYYEITLSPEERERRKIERRRREAERKHLEFVEKEARARARGEAYGSKIGYERAKDDIAFERNPPSYDTSALTDYIWGEPAPRKKKKR